MLFSTIPVFFHLLFSRTELYSTTRATMKTSIRGVWGGGGGSRAPPKNSSVQCRAPSECFPSLGRRRRWEGRETVPAFFFPPPELQWERGFPLPFPPPKKKVLAPTAEDRSRAFGKGGKERGKRTVPRKSGGGHRFSNNRNVFFRQFFDLTYFSIVLLNRTVSTCC